MYCSRVARYNDGQKDKKLSLGMLKVQYIHTISYIVHKYSLKEKTQSTNNNNTFFATR